MLLILCDIPVLVASSNNEPAPVARSSAENPSDLSPLPVDESPVSSPMISAKALAPVEVSPLKLASVLELSVTTF